MRFYTFSPSGRSGRGKLEWSRWPDFTLIAELAMYHLFTKGGEAGHGQERE